MIIIAHTIDDARAAEIRRSLVATTAPVADERTIRIRWLALRHHRRARLANDRAASAWHAIPDDAA